MEETNHAIARWLTEAGWSETYVNLAVKAVIILGILVVAYAAAVLFRRGRSASAKNQRPDESRVGRPPFQRQGDAPRGAPDSASDLVRPAPGGFLRTRPFC